LTGRLGLGGGAASGGGRIGRTGRAWTPRDGGRLERHGGRMAWGTVVVVVAVKWERVQKGGVFEGLG
jgi:hypothetical protein